MTVHEREVQLRAFDASLMAGAEALMGAVQDAEDAADNVMLDMRGVQLPKDATFLVEDEKGRILGTAGDPPHLEASASDAPVFRNVDASRRYRFVVLRGLRIIDPGQANGGAHHTMPPLKTNSDYSAYIRSRTAAWIAAKKRTAAAANRL